jgi:hypothetical protein
MAVAAIYGLASLLLVLGVHIRRDSRPRPVGLVDPVGVIPVPGAIPLIVWYASEALFR